MPPHKSEVLRNWCSVCYHLSSIQTVAAQRNKRVALPIRGVAENKCRSPKSSEILFEHESPESFTNSTAFAKTESYQFVIDYRSLARAGARDGQPCIADERYRALGLADLPAEWFTTCSRAPAKFALRRHRALVQS